MSQYNSPQNAQYQQPLSTKDTSSSGTYNLSIWSQSSPGQNGPDETSPYRAPFVPDPSLGLTPHTVQTSDSIRRNPSVIQNKQNEPTTMPAYAYQQQQANIIQQNSPSRVGQYHQQYSPQLPVNLATTQITSFGGLQPTSRPAPPAMNVDVQHLLQKPHLQPVSSASNPKFVNGMNGSARFVNPLTMSYSSSGQENRTIGVVVQNQQLEAPSMVSPSRIKQENGHGSGTECVKLPSLFETISRKPPMSQQLSAFNSYCILKSSSSSEENLAPIPSMKPAINGSVSESKSGSTTETSSHSNGGNNIMVENDQVRVAKELAFLKDYCSRKLQHESSSSDQSSPKQNIEAVEAAHAMLKMQQAPGIMINEDQAENLIKVQDSNGKVDPDGILSTVPISSISPDQADQLSGPAVVTTQGSLTSEESPKTIEDSEISAPNSINALLSRQLIPNLINSLPTTPYPDQNMNLLSSGSGSMTKPQESFMNAILINSFNNGNGSSAHQSIPMTIYKCQVCKFSSTSKFHFNSHMNTHTDHKCSYCDYTSRTIGRLKRHMNDFHTHPTTSSNVVSTSTEGSGDMSTPMDILANPATSLINTTVANLLEGAINLKMESKVFEPSSGNMTDKIPTTSAPTVPSKPKNYRCKTCCIILTSKNDYWNHQRTHIKGDRILSCPKCTFVTEYKHHLEYHLRNHFGSKPFKCQKCNYTCVNKSMLNSHMKSHSNFYPYRCVDCRYTTKYCHSLKLHLQKYGHTSVTQLPNESPESEIEAARIEAAQQAAQAGLGMTSRPLSQSVITNPNLPQISRSFGDYPGLISNPLSNLLRHQHQMMTAAAMGFANGGPQLPTMVSGFNATQLVPTTSSMMDTNNENSPEALQCKICGCPFDDRDSMTAHMFKHVIESNELGRFQRSQQQQQQQYHHDVTESLLPPSQVLKCNFCYQADFDSKESLANHLVKHLVENNELFRLYGLSNGTGTTESMMTHHHLPNPHHNAFLEALRSNIEAQHGFGALSLNLHPSGESRSTSDPDNDLLHDSNSPASTTADKHSGTDETGGSDPGRTTAHTGGLGGGGKRRKGKAYKLDQLSSQRFQRCSSASPDLLAGTGNGYHHNGHHHEAALIMARINGTQRYLVWCYFEVLVTQKRFS